MGAWSRASLFPDSRRCLGSRPQSLLRCRLGFWRPVLSSRRVAGSVSRSMAGLWDRWRTGPSRLGAQGLLGDLVGQGQGSCLRAMPAFKLDRKVLFWVRTVSRKTVCGTVLRLVSDSQLGSGGACSASKLVQMGEAGVGAQGANSRCCEQKAE